MPVALAVGCLLAAGIFFGGWAGASAERGSGGATRATAVAADCVEFLKGAPALAISRETEVKQGGAITLSLCSNGTTGFRWGEPTVGRPAVLQTTGHEYSAPQGGLLGAAGKETWSFRALAEGHTTVTLEYSQPWPGGTKATWTFVLTVVVK